MAVIQTLQESRLTSNQPLANRPEWQDQNSYYLQSLHTIHKSKTWKLAVKVCVGGLWMLFKAVPLCLRHNDTAAERRKGKMGGSRCVFPGWSTFFFQTIEIRSLMNKLSNEWIIDVTTMAMSILWCLPWYYLFVLLVYYKQNCTINLKKVTSRV